MPTDEWVEFTGFNHDDSICRAAGTQCHQVFILILDWNFYLDCVQFDWLRGV